MTAEVAHRDRRSRHTDSPQIVKLGDHRDEGMWWFDLSPEDRMRYDEYRSRYLKTGEVEEFLLAGNARILFTGRQVAAHFNRTPQWFSNLVRTKKLLDQDGNIIEPDRYRGNTAVWSTKNVRDIGISLYAQGLLTMGELKSLIVNILVEENRLNQKLTKGGLPKLSSNMLWLKQASGSESVHHVRF